MKAITLCRRDFINKDGIDHFNDYVLEPLGFDLRANTVNLLIKQATIDDVDYSENEAVPVLGQNF